MINIGINIKNPFWPDVFNNVWHKSWKISKNKIFEVQCLHDSFNLFELSIVTDIKGYDHAGPSFTINVFGYVLMLSLYDNRHWDLETNNWETKTYDN